MQRNLSVRKDEKLIYCSIVAAFIVMLLFVVCIILPLFHINENGHSNMRASDDLLSVDNEPPQIIGVRNLTVYLGEAIAYRKNITLTDNNGDDGVFLNIDSSKVDLSTPGTYAATYIATDKAGNESRETIFVTVVESQISLEELNSKLDSVIAVIIRNDMNTEEKIRAVYEYVQSHMSYVSDSDKSDWRAEAYRALFVSGSGDCFSFFAASKAFFERLGIVSLDVQRTPGLVEQTHYWSIVNISDDVNNNVWYYYDSCPLRSEYNHSGCLLTEIQIEAYNKVREHFYTYDRDTYRGVIISEKIITPTPELESFYSQN